MFHVKHVIGKNKKTSVSRETKEIMLNKCYKSKKKRGIFIQIPRFLNKIRKYYLIISFLIIPKTSCLPIHCIIKLKMLILCNAPEIGELIKAKLISLINLIGSAPVIIIIISKVMVADINPAISPKNLSVNPIILIL